MHKAEERVRGELLVRAIEGDVHMHILYRTFLEGHEGVGQAVGGQTYFANINRPAFNTTVYAVGAADR